MIKINLAVLLAERGIKITDLAKQTGLSRTTLTSLYYNQSKGIQWETLDTLCDYLKVKPNAIIMHERFSYTFGCSLLAEFDTNTAQGAGEFPISVSCKIIYNDLQIQETFKLTSSFSFTDYDVGSTVEHLSTYGRLPEKISSLLNDVPQLAKTDFFKDLKDEISFCFNAHLPIGDSTIISLEIS